MVHSKILSLVHLFSGSSSSSKTIGLARMILAIGSFLAHYGEDRPASYALNLWSLATLAFLFIAGKKSWLRNLCWSILENLSVKTISFAALECVFLQKLNDVRSAKLARQNGGTNSRSARGNRNFAGWVLSNQDLYYLKTQDFEKLSNNKVKKFAKQLASEVNQFKAYWSIPNTNIWCLIYI